MSTIEHPKEIKQKADQLDAHGINKDSEILKKDMRSAPEVMYQDRLSSALPDHLKNEFPQQSGGLPTTYGKPLVEERKEDRFAQSNALHKEIQTKASKMNEPHVGPIYNGFERGQVETTDKPITANGFHGTSNINEPTNPLVKDFLVSAQNNSFKPLVTADKPKDNSLIHSDEADRRAMGLGKNEMTDRPDPNQLQTSLHMLSTAEPLHNQGGDEMIKNRPLGAEETKESLGPYQQSMPVQKEYMTMASKKSEDMGLGEKIMDTAAHGWNEAKSWLAGEKKHENEESGEKLADKAADTWETTKEKASDTVEAVKEKAAETKESISKEISPAKEEKSMTENLKDKAEAGWEGAEEKAKKTVTYVSDTMHDSAEHLWNKAHKRDDKLYVNDSSDKTQFEKIYEQAYENSEMKASDAKDLLEEPHERAVQIGNLGLHNPIERTDEAKNKEEIIQENAGTASELLAPRIKDEDLKPHSQKLEEKRGNQKADLGLQKEDLSKEDKKLGERLN